MLAYNCSASFNWAKHMDAGAMARFQREIAAMGYRFPFVTPAGFHTLNHATFRLARAYAAEGQSAYSRLPQEEFADEDEGDKATRQQSEDGDRKNVVM